MRNHATHKVISKTTNTRNVTKVSPRSSLGDSATSVASDRFQRGRKEDQPFAGARPNGRMGRKPEWACFRPLPARDGPEVTLTRLKREPATIVCAAHPPDGRARVPVAAESSKFPARKALRLHFFGRPPAEITPIP